MVEGLRRKFILLICVVAAVFALHQVDKASEFPIYVHNAPYDATWDSSAVDSAFALLKDFGVTFIMSWGSRPVYRGSKKGGIPIMQNQGAGHLDFNVHPTRTTPAQRSAWDSTFVRLPSVDSMYLFDVQTTGVYAEMVARNTNRSLGYEMVSNHTGSLDYDEVALEDVFQAHVVTDSAGMLLNGLMAQSELAVPLPRSVAGGGQRKLTMRARMRVDDLEGDTNLVVARLVVENTAWRDHVGNDAVGIYVTEVVNDTLLVHHGNGDSVLYTDTIPPGAIQAEAQIHEHDFWAPGDTDRYILRDTIVFNDCWIDTSGGGADTICVLPYKYTRDITLGQFTAALTYQDFELPSYVHAHTGSWAKGDPWYKIYQYNYFAEWTASKDLYLDSLVLFNDTGLAVIQSGPSQIAADLDDYCTMWAQEVDTTADAVFYDRWYIVDEVADQSFSMAQQIKRAIEECSVCPQRSIFTSERPWQLKDAKSGTDKRGVDVYQHYYDTIVAMDPYPFSCDTKFDVTDYGDPQSVIHNLDNMCGWMDELMSRIEVMPSPKETWYYLAQAFAPWKKIDSTIQGGVATDYVWQREGYPDFPTAEAMAAQLNLALAYNAKGIGYYYTLGSPDSPTPETDPVTMLRSQAADDPREQDLGLSLSGGCEMVTLPADTSPQDVALLKLNEQGIPVPCREEAWLRAREINLFAKRNADFFTGADWLGAGDASGAASITGSFIDSVVRRDDSDMYAQISFWEHNSQDFLYLVNKSTEPGDTALLDLFATRVGLFEFREMDSDSLVWADTVWDSSGVVHSVIDLAPGDGKLIRLSEIYKTWSGVLTRSWTWPDYSLDTIRIVGDITVPSGSSLTITTPRISIPANSDALSSGTDHNKIELDVLGSLWVESSEGERIVFDSDEGTDSSWYGITGPGKHYLDNVVIKNAYSGVFGTSADTIINSRFENCFMHGVYSSYSGPYLYKDTFLVTESDTSEGYGVYAIAQASPPTRISNCYFRDIKYPVAGIWRARVNIDSCYFYRS